MLVVLRNRLFIHRFSWPRAFSVMNGSLYDRGHTFPSSVCLITTAGILKGVHIKIEY